MTSSLRKSFNNGFVLTEQELRKIYATIEQQIRQVTNNIAPWFELEFANGIVGERPSLNAVLDEENEGDRAIRALTIKLTGQKDANEIASILLKFAAEPSNPISYLITGNDETWISHTSIELEKRVSKVKRFAFHQLNEAINTLPRVNVTQDIIEVAVRSFTKYRTTSDYTFAWGAGLDRLNKQRSLKSYIRNIILVGILLAFIVGVAAGIVANYISALLKIGAGH